MAQGATLALAEFVAHSNADRLPRELFRLAKLYVLDTLGVVVFGGTKPWSAAVARYARGLGASGPASVVGASWTAPPAIASLVNGTAGHAFELDDVHDESLLHPGTVVVPAALAVAEATKASGRDFLAAVILGYELIARVGLGVGSLAHMMGGFHSTGTNGVFGSAAAAAKLLDGGNANTILHAMAIAASAAGGLMEFSQTGGMVKRLHAGRAAESGVMAAYLARDGFTGPTSALEGPYGYCSTYSRAPEPERLLVDLGRRFAIEEITVKAYACCSDLHATIDCVRELKTRRGFDVADIKRIVVEIYDKVIKQNALDGTTSIMAAQYSILFAISAGLLYDIADPRTYAEATLRDPRIRELSGKIELRLDAEFDALYPRKLPARVIIETKDGQQHRAEVIYAKGHPMNPMSAAEIEAKFRRLAGTVLGPSAVAEAVERVDALDQAPSLTELARTLRV